jgi:hypothetical protein
MVRVPAIYFRLACADCINLTRVPGGVEQLDHFVCMQAAQAAAALLRMKMPNRRPGRLRSRSPNKAPPENGLVGSTAMMPTVNPVLR